MYVDERVSIFLWLLLLWLSVYIVVVAVVVVAVIVVAVVVAVVVVANVCLLLSLMVVGDWSCSYYKKFVLLRNMNCCQLLRVVVVVGSNVPFFDCYICHHFFCCLCCNCSLMFLLLMSVSVSVNIAYMLTEHCQYFHRHYLWYLSVITLGCVVPFIAVSSVT